LRRIFMKIRFVIITIACLVVISILPAMALDHGNLDEGRPLQIQDAYPVSLEELVVEAGAGFAWRRHSSDQGFFPVQFVYGILPNTQLELGTTFFTSPHEIDSPGKSGDVSVGALYNFNQETLTLPAFALKGSLQLPSGVDSSGIESEVTGIVTKSLHRLVLSFNAEYQFIGGHNRDERNSRYKFVFGGGYPVGSPKHTRTVLLADVFLNQAASRGERKTLGGEIGLRHQLRERLVLDLGVGSEFSGPTNRSPLYVNAGFSVGF
jgi:hypothetical protein